MTWPFDSAGCECGGLLSLFQSCTETCGNVLFSDQKPCAPHFPIPDLNVDKSEKPRGEPAVEGLHCML